MAKSKSKGFNWITLSDRLEEEARLDHLKGHYEHPRNQQGDYEDCEEEGPPFFGKKKNRSRHDNPDNGRSY